MDDALERENLQYQKAWFASLRDLIEGGQIIITVRNTDGFQMHWVANLLEMNGGPIVIGADLGQPPHREVDKRRRD